jgi:hypothetical protein
MPLTGTTSFGFTAAQDKALPYDVVQKCMDGINTLETAFVSGQARVSAFHSTTQSINSASATKLNFDSEDFDVGVMHDAVTNNTRVTIPASNGGVYLVIGGTAFAPNATGYRQLDIFKNNTTILASITVPTNTAGSPSGVFQVSCLVSLAATDFLELLATQNTGGALNVGSATRSLASFLQVARLW